jgi:hypothetical protein
MLPIATMIASFRPVVAAREATCGLVSVKFSGDFDERPDLLTALHRRGFSGVGGGQAEVMRALPQT